MSTTNLFDRLLPRTIDNTYRGSRIALWLFAVVLLMRIAMSINCILNGYSVASTADGIPLDTFPRAAAQVVVSLVGSWGIAQLAISILGVIVLVRYRSAISFMFALILADLVSRQVLHRFIPVVRTGTSPAGTVNLVLFSLMFVGLALSLVRPSNRRRPETLDEQGA